MKKGKWGQCEIGKEFKCQYASCIYYSMCSCTVQVQTVHWMLINALISLREIWNRDENINEGNRNCLGCKGYYQTKRLG